MRTKLCDSLLYHVHYSQIKPADTGSNRLRRLMQDMNHDIAAWCGKSRCQCLPLECLKEVLMKLLVGIQTHAILGSPKILRGYINNRLSLSLCKILDPPLSCIILMFVSLSIGFLNPQLFARRLLTTIHYHVSLFLCIFRKNVNGVPKMCL